MKSTEQNEFRYHDVAVIFFCGLTLMTLCGGIYYNFGTFYFLILEQNLINAPLLALVGTSCDNIFVLVLPHAAAYLKRNRLDFAIFVGGSMISLGLLVSSFLRQMYLWFLTYSLVIGLGEGLTYMVVVEMVISKAPKSIRSFLMGFTSGGMFIGLSIFAPLMLNLEKTANLWIALRILSGIMGGTTLLVLVVWKCRKPHLAAPPERRTLQSENLVPVDQTHSICFWLRDFHFQLLFASTLCVAIGYIVPFTHLLKAAEIDGVTDIHFIPISMGLTGFLGRLACGAIADILSKKYPERPHNLYIFTLCVFSCGVLLCCLPFCNSLWSYSAAAGVYGFFGGARAGLMAVMCVEVFGESKATVAFGYLYWAFIAQVAGPSFVAHLQEQSGDYMLGFLLIGIITVLAAIPLIYICFAISNKMIRSENHYVKLSQ